MESSWASDIARAAGHQQNSSHGRGARHNVQSAADEVVRTQRAKEVATETTLRRRKRLRHLQREITEAERAEREAVAAAAMAQEDLDRTRRTTATEAAATPTPPRGR